MVIANIKAKLSDYIDVDYFVKFLILLTTLYYFNVFYIAVVDKKGLIYSSFLDNYLNYIACVRYFIMYVSNAIVNVMGVDSHVYSPDYLRTLSRAWVQVEPGCLALNLLIFWVAFVIPNKESLKRKITWCVAGVLGICIINCLRISFLLIGFDHRWKPSTFANHHTQFNLVAYSLILFMIYLYTKTSKNKLEIQPDKNI